MKSTHPLLGVGRLASTTSALALQLVTSLLALSFCAWTAASRAENTFLHVYSANSVTLPAASKEDVCQNIFPKTFHPQLNWRNTRFHGWMAGMTDDRYAFNFWPFACIGDNDLFTNDVRNVGQGRCNGEFVDAKRERCVCQPNAAIMENGLCITPSSSTCTLVIDGVCHGGDNNGPPCPSCGNPINPANGNKFVTESLYRGQFGSYFDLAYNTQDEESSVRFGRRWRDSFDRRIAIAGSAAVAYRPDGRGTRFVASTGAWVPDADTKDQLTEIQNPPGTRIGWQLYVANTEETENYDASGTLLTIVSRNGLTQTLTYSDGTGGPGGGFALDDNGQMTSMVLPAGLLLRAADPVGRALVFGYSSAMRVSRVTDPAGGTYRFTYDGAKRLSSVTFPDTKARSYHYNEPENTSGIVQLLALTGITDENGVRFATYKYDTSGRAISTELAGGVNRYSVSYAAGSASVSDPRSVTRSYAFQNTLGAFKNTSISGLVCPTCGPKSQTYDANGNVSSRTDWNDNRTNYAYDLTRNLETSRTEALTSAGGTTPQTRTITTAWHPTFRLPTQIAEPLRITTNVYDADGTQCGAKGALCSRTIQATTDPNGSQGLSATLSGAPRTSTFTYNANASVLTINGPRTDVSDLTTYTYYLNDDPDLGKRGNVATVTNALAHRTDITAYNAHGQPLTIVDANAVTTTLTYDERQRLKTRTVGSELTSFDYGGIGLVTKVTLPDGSFLSYGYDSAHRLESITDNDGNRIAYTLDAMGNRTLEEVFDPANQLAQKRSRVYSNLNRLFQELGAQNQTTEYGYDDQGNVTSVKDPLNRITSNQYDALNRLRQVTSPAPISAVTQYAYNGLDALTQVTDPRNLVTGYTVDGLGNLTQQSSPDTGNTVNTYDHAGNLRTQTDAKGQQTTYAYDVLNRVTLVTFHDGSKQTYAYDQGTNGIGRLSSITETDPANQQTSLIEYGYSAHGRVTSETRTVGGVQYATGYGYDAGGRLSGITYPSGRTLTYTFDALGRISGISTTFNSQTQQVVSGVTYHPFGGVKGYTLGNGQTYARSYDQDGRIGSYTLGSKSFSIGYDAASRIDFINEFGNPANTNTYGHDDLDRLTSAVIPGTSYSYSYDAVGNRRTKTAGAATETIDYSTTSNRIATLTPATGPQRTFVFDPNGSTTNDGVNTFTYDVRGRMVQSVGALGATNYQVNAFGQRIRKANTQGDTVFHYDIGGRLIAETIPAGALKREVIYLGDIPVGVVQ